MSYKKTRHSLPDYKMNDLLGRGTYGTVYKAYTKDRQLVAIKCIDKKSLQKESIDNIITEISITKKIKNQFIVQLLDFKWTESDIYMIFEFCCGGELAQMIRMKTSFTQPIVHHFLQQIATALKTLRSHSIAHMDLKPQNILISSKVTANCWRNVVLKIADFGFAQYLRNEDFGTSLRGSPLYMAPEILLRNKYDASVDLWSVGIILYECLYGRAPFSSDSFEELSQKIKSSEPIEIPLNIDLSDDCRDLLNRLLQRDPRNRISFEDFFEHSFIDLEHMPSLESYQKGVQLIREAVEKDRNCEYKESFKLYTEGLRYLVELYNWGDGTTVWDPNTQMEFKNKLIEYMKRAEDMKLKCNLIAVDNKDLQSIQKAYELTERANHFIKTKAFEQAFNDYNKAIEIGFQLIPKLNANDKTILYEHLNQWITKAEQLKTQFKTCDKYSNKQSFKKTKNTKTNNKSLSFDNFVSKNSNSRDLRLSPTCYVQ